MKKIIKKRYVIVVILVALFAIPTYEYIQSLRLYFKFSSKINPYTDPILKEKSKNETFIPSTFDVNARLFYLCKIWGFIKYYREDMRLSTSQIDSLLLTNISEVIRSDSKIEYHSILERVISFPILPQFEKKNPYPDINDYALINNGWMSDTICLNMSIKKTLEDIFYAHSGRKNRYVFNKSTGNISFIDKAGHSTFPETDRRLLGFFDYWNIINYFYVYKNYIDDSWDRVLHESIQRFMLADSPKKYHMEIRRLTNRLKDTHASYPATIDEYMFGAYRPNFRMSLINDTFVISQIRVAEYDQGLFKLGDVVLQIDGHKTHQLADSLRDFVCGGNYWSDQMFVCNAILSKSDSVTEFTLLRERDTLSIKSINYKAYDLFQNERTYDREHKKQTLYHWVNDTIAYLNLRFSSANNIYDNYNAIKTASVIILDMRSYPDTDIIWPLTDLFVPPNSFFAYTTYPDTRFPGMLRYCRSSSGRIGREDYFKGRIIVLVNEWTRSFSEYATMALQMNPRTITVGNSTSGADGNISLFTFPGEVRTIYSGIGIYYPDFTPTQRVGVRVDYTVEPKINDIKKKIDTAYEEAITIAKQEK